MMAKSNPKMRMPQRSTWLQGTFYIIILLTSPTLSQILDVYNAVMYEDPNPVATQKSSYFGYSVVLYSKNGTTWLAVGAPRANSSSLNKVFEPGEIWRCGFKEVCSPIYIDHTTTREISVKAGKFYEKKDGSWLGGSMALQPENDNLAVCAPKRMIDIVSNDERLMLGSCYITKLNQQFSYSPLYVNPLFVYKKITITKHNTNVFYYGLGGAGISAHFSPVKDSAPDSSLVLGAPGIFNSMGSTILMTHAQNSSRVSNPAINDKDFENIVVPVVHQSKQFLDGDYLGYALTSGYFYRTQLYYVAAAPKSNGYTGKVMIYKFPRQTEKAPIIKQILIGDEIGAYFGASLAAADFNGDGCDDLLVGAPFGKEPKVHVYHGSETNLLPPLESGTKYLKISRFGKFSQFGISLATTDFNHDGYSDVVVGAPEADEKGAVAVFMGKSYGLEGSPIQIIYASEGYKGVLRGFGISLATPTDIDENNYADIAIGAYKSGHTVILRGIPEAHLKAKLKPLGKLEGDIIKVEACLLYSWTKNYHTAQNLTVMRSVTVDEAYSRGTLLKEGLRHGNTYKQAKTLSAMNESCEILEIKLQKSLDYMIPLEITLRAVKKEQPKTHHVTEITADKVLSNDFFDKWDPRIKDLDEGIHTLSVPLLTNCGEDNVCTADLSVNAHFPNYTNTPFIIGSTDTIIMQIAVKNNMESAYMTEVKVMLPPKASLARMPSVCRFEDVIICKVDNPLVSGSTKALHLEIDMRGISESVQQSGVKMFSVEATTTSNEVNYEDNIATVSLQLALDSKVLLAGKSQKDTYSLSGTDKTSTYEFVEFKHLYEVQKFGSSNVDEVLLEVLVPTKYEKDHRDIKFLEIYEPEGFQNGQPFSCERSSYIYAHKISTSEDGNDEKELLPNVNAAAKMKRSIEATKYFKSLMDDDDAVYEKYGISVMDHKHLRFRREIREESLNELPANRTVFLSCDLPNVLCHTIRCRIGPFRRSQHVARLLVTMSMNISTLKEHVMGVKDIISYTTHGGATIVRGQGEGGTAKITSVFVSSPPQLKVDLWIIILSAVLGLLLVLLVTVGLVKAGFFQRKKKKELEAMMEAEAAKKKETREPVDETDEPLQNENFSLEQE